MQGAENQGSVEQKPDEIDQETKKVAKKANEQTLEGTGLSEIQQRAVMAYAAYIEAEREVEKAYLDQQKKIEKDYLETREKARKACEESIAQALKAREAAEEKARKDCDEKVALAMKAREEADLKSLEARNVSLEQSWDIFIKSRK
jgi:hypothetical protein